MNLVWEIFSKKERCEDRESKYNERTHFLKNKIKEPSQDSKRNNTYEAHLQPVKISQNT
jgi:hypothetical protein